MYRSMLLCIFSLCLGLAASLAVVPPGEARAAGATDGLKVLSTGPQGEVENLTQITVRFSEPMRALGVMEDSEATAPLSFSVPGGILPPGNFRWLDPATLTYFFDKAVDVPLRIDAKVPAGAKALSGATLAKEIRWQINMPSLALELEKDGDLPRDNALLTLASNYPFDLGDLRAKSRVRAGGKDVRFTLSENCYPGYAFGGRQIRWHYGYTLLDSLEPGTKVTLTLERGAVLAGNAGAAPAVSFETSSYKPLRLNAWGAGYRDDKGESMSLEERMVVRFNNPVRLRDLLAHVSVSPAARLDASYEADEDGDNVSTNHALPFVWAPRTNYTVTLQSGMADTYGTKLQKEQRFSFKTGDASPVCEFAPGIFIEPALGGIAYLDLCNVGKIDLRLRYVPWKSPEAFAAYAKLELDFEESETIQGAVTVTESLDFSQQPNTNIRHALDIPALLGLPGPEAFDGFVEVHLTLRDPWDSSKMLNETRYFQITPIALTIKTGQDASLVLATDLESGRPVSGVHVQGFDLDERPVWSGKTNADGIAELPGGAAVELVKGEKDGKTVVATMTRDSLSEPFYNLTKGDDSQRRWQSHMVSQLPLYQPGQEVNFTVFSRVFTNEETGPDGKPVPLPYDDWRPVANEKFIVTIRDSRDEIVHSQQSVSNAYGSLSGSFTLSGEANLGRYFVILQSERFASSTDTYAFQVASFRPPNFKVDVAAPGNMPKPLSQDAPLRVTVDAGYFSGLPVPGAETTLLVECADAHYAPSGLSGYATGVTTWRMPYRSGRPIRSELHGTLDGKGRGIFTLSNMQAIEPGKPQSINLTAEVTDTTGLVTQGAASFMLHPSSLYTGIRAPRVAPVGMDAFVELKAVTWDDKPVPTATVRLEAHRSLKDGKSEKAWEKSLQLDTPQGRRFAVRFDRSGQYTLTATIKDAQGRENIARTLVYVPGPDMAWGSRSGEEQFELMADKDGYTPGETAVIMIDNPFDEALALVTTERRGVQSSRILSVSGPTPTVEIPLSRDDAPYVFASVTLIKGRTMDPPVGDVAQYGLDQGAPKVLYSRISLAVDAQQPKLTARIETDSSEYRPGATVKASVFVADTAGKARRAQVTLLAVDERILRAAGEVNRYDPRASFNALFSSGVRSADIRERLLDLGNPLLGGLEIRSAAGEANSFAPMVHAKAGDGGGKGLRQNFSPLAFWLAEGESDKAGKLAVSFTLPDTLTSYRIVAVVTDTRNDFTTAEHSIKATKPLQLIPALPRFLTEGDALEARVLVQNMSGTRALVRVEAEGAGVTLGETRREITLAAGESGRVVFPLQAGMSGTAHLTLRGSMTVGGVAENDAVQISLPILPRAPMTTVAAAGLLEENGTYTLPVQIPRPLDARSSLNVQMAASPAAGLSLIADELLLYPWHCLEQRLSRAWVRIIRMRHGDLLGLAPVNDDAAVIAETLESVAKFQNEDGGFSIWPGMGHSNYYLTAYVLLVNMEAERVAGAEFSLSDRVKEAAYAWLADTLQNSVSDQGSDTAMPLAADAMAAWVLAAQDPSGVNDLYPQILQRAEKFHIVNPMTWGALLMVAQHLDDAAKDQERIVALLEKNAAITPTQLHFAANNTYGTWMTMGSTLRDNGMVLGALAVAKPDYPRLEALAHWVAQGLGERHSLSTQEAIFGMWGLSSYMHSLGGNRPVSIEAVWNGTQSVTKSFARLADPAQGWNLAAADIDSAGESTLTLKALQGKPYWTARLRYGSSSLPVRAENAGFTITRTWLTPGPWKMGDTVDVSVTLTVPDTRRHVLLFDPFPAGLEPLYASRADLAEEDQRYQHPWQFQESREDGMLLYAESIRPGVYTYTYTLRAAAPGSFIQRPSFVEEMYTPEVFGRTTTDEVTITP